MRTKHTEDERKWNCIIRMSCTDPVCQRGSYFMHLFHSYALVSLSNVLFGWFESTNKSKIPQIFVVAFAAAAFFHSLWRVNVFCLCLSVAIARRFAWKCWCSTWNFNQQKQQTNQPTPVWVQALMETWMDYCQCLWIRFFCNIFFCAWHVFYFVSLKFALSLFLSLCFFQMN